jgi:lipoprotein-anchoring transpeptidase ErfK/SrfK
MFKPYQSRGARERPPARQGYTMSVSAIAKFVASVSLCAACLVTTPAAAQRAVGGYADQDFQDQALAAGGYPQPRFKRYPQQRSSESYGGDSLDLISGGQPSGDGYSASYPQSGKVGYDHASYRQAAYGPAGAFDAAVQRGVNPIYLRQEVEYDGRQPPGTIVIDSTNKFLYLVQAGGRALRYGIGVGRPGFMWSGVKQVSRKAEWPAWTPPPEMLGRRPDLPRHMEGGPANPLGARALYLGSSLYRIHGTNEPDTIGENVSSGCIRMMNEDVSDLYTRVGIGTRVVVVM